jgi:trk system potassium uptake protein
MSVLRFVRPLDRRTIRHHVGLSLQLVSALLVVPLLAALTGAEFGQAGVFAVVGLGSALVGTLLRVSEGPALALREALVVSALVYLVYGVVGTIPFLTVVGPVDAFFESMAGFTSTGLTVTDDLPLPASLLLFRAYIQWIGGGGIIILSVVVLSGPGSAASRLYALEFGPDDIRGSVSATTRVVIVAYVVLTAIAYVVLLLAGTGGFDGLLHALTGIATGGFSPYVDSIGAYRSVTVSAVTIAIMLLGAVSFPLYYHLARRDWGYVRRDPQLRALVLLTASVVVAVSVIHARDPGAAFDASFDVLSAFTTTGFTVTQPSEWPTVQRVLALALMLFGGSVGSTTGGLKLMRLVIFAKLVSWTFLRALVPQEAKVALKVGTETIGGEELRRSATFAALYAGVVAVSVLGLSAAGASFEDAVFESVSALSNVGQSIGLTSRELSAWTKVLLCVDMWMGRLEILPVLVLFYPAHWRGGGG